MRTRRDPSLTVADDVMADDLAEFARLPQR
jgi:hypothetical protein